MLPGNSLHEILVAASIAAGVLVLVWLARTFAARKLAKAHLTETEVDDFLLDVTRRTKLFLLFAPAVFLGAAVGVVAAAWLPGLGLLPALAIGMAAGVATTGLPVTSAVLVVLLLGDSATSQMPVVLLAVVLLSG